jgi:two-component system chemotaxis response regulator CheY
MRILIVDDSSTYRKSLREVLEPEGHQIFESQNGKDALEFLNEESLLGMDLIITDLNMPQMDGICFLEEVRRTPEFAQVDAFVLTTEAAGIHRNRGRDLGVRAWIVKPCPPERLIDAIRRLQHP